MYFHVWNLENDNGSQGHRQKFEMFRLRNYVHMMKKYFEN